MKKKRMQVTKLEATGYQGVSVELSYPGFPTVGRLNPDLHVSFVTELADEYRMGEWVTVTIEREWELDSGPLPMRTVLNDARHRYEATRKTANEKYRHDPDPEPKKPFTEMSHLNE